MPQPNAIAAPMRSAAAARDALLVVVGVALLALSARAQVPFWPVPMTLQTLVVLGWAAAFGDRVAVGSTLGYLAIGALGLPVFAGTPERGIGLAYMMGPTGGYLIGFALAAAFVGRLSAGRGFLHRLITLLLGVLIIDGLGALWLMRFLPPAEAIQKGAGLFVAVDLVKAAIVAVGATLAEPALKRLRPTD